MTEILDKITPEHWLAVFFFLLLVTWGIAIFLFGRITVKHIEKEMAKEGLPPPSWDQGIGTKITAYAGIIIFPNLKRHASLVNIEATKRHARRKDFYLALLLEGSFFALAIVATLAYLLYGSDV